MSDPDAVHNLRGVTFLVWLRDGEDIAFDTLVSAYGDSLIRYATGIVNSVDMAQDIVQEVFLYLWRERSQIDSSWDIVSYLYGLTRKRAIDAARAAQTATQRDERWTAQLQVEVGTAATIDTSTDDGSDMKTVVWNALTDVSPRCREVFMLVWEDELPYAEIARRMKLAEPTIRVYVSRALKQLIDVLRP